MRKNTHLHLRQRGEWPLRGITIFILLIILGSLQNTLLAQSIKHDDARRTDQGNSYRERNGSRSSSGLNRIVSIKSDSVVVLHKASKDVKIITSSNKDSTQLTRIPRISMISKEALQKTASDSVSHVWKKIHTVNSKQNDN